MIARFLCWIGIHKWHTDVIDPSHDFFIYPAHQICKRESCHRSRMWDHTRGEWYEYDYCD